jgi:hypothetical protein
MRQAGIGLEHRVAVKGQGQVELELRAVANVSISSSRIIVP